MKKALFLFILLMFSAVSFAQIGSTVMYDINDLDLEFVEKTWFPKDIVHEGVRITMGYNQPGESENDGRDVRIWTDSNKLVAGDLGRIVVKAENDDMSYATPSNMPIYVYKDEYGRTIWSWGWTDHGSGVMQNNTMIFDNIYGCNEAMVIISVKFLKEIKGSISVPFLTAEQNWNTFDSLGIECDLSKASGFETDIDGRKFCFSFQADEAEGITLRNNYQNYYHLVRRVADMGDMYLEGTFPKGYENDFIININLSGEPYFIRASMCVDPKIRTDMQFADVKTVGGKEEYYIPKVPKTLTFLPGEKQKIVLDVLNVYQGKRTQKIDWKVRDYDNNIVADGSRTLSLKSGDSKYTVFDFNLPFGIYSATFSCDGQEVTRRFIVLHSPTEIDRNDSLFGIQAVFSSDEDDYIDLLKRIGCHFIRVGNGGTWWPADKEACFRKYDENNIGYFFTMTPNDLENFSVKDFGSPYYEVFNEPDSWVPVKEYPGHVKNFREKIKSINPSAKIVAGSVSNGDTDSGFPYIKNLYDSGEAFDILSIHPYACARAVGPGLEPLSPEKNRFYEKLGTAVDLAKAHGNEIWIGELGNTLLEECRFPEPEFNKYEKQYANYLARIFLNAKMYPEIKKLVYFHICLDKLGLRIGPDADNNGPYNMLGVANNPEPILAAYAALAASFDGWAFQEKLVYNDEDLKGMICRKGDKYFLALWSAKDKFVLKTGKAKNVTIRNLCGTDREFTGDTITVSEEPVYFITDNLNFIENAKIAKYDKIKVTAEKKEVDYSALDVTWHAKENSKPITVDGDLSEWDDLPILLNRQESVIPPDPGFWKGAEDLSAKIGAKYDDKYLYLGVEVTDDIHRNSQEPAGLWKEDSLQVSLSNVSFPFSNVEMNVGKGKDGVARVYPLVGGMEEIKGALVSVERKENRTVYELALPFSEFDISLGIGSYARLGLIINDLDVTEQRKWMGVKDPVYVGIVKEPTNMPVLHFE